MTRGTSAAWMSAALLFAGSIAAPALVQQSGGATTSRGELCCLNNFRYAGTCEVTLAPGETCGSVLAYLNDLNSAGQRYCGNTVIRGGWTLIPCDGARGGVSAKPGAVKVDEPASAAVIGPVQPVSPSATGAVPRGGATFITPVSPSTPVKASEPELIDL